MRLRRLDLTRYGKFTDQSIDFGAAPPAGPDLHIVYGLNEAGKSTTFAAYLDLLFGIADRSPYNFLHPYNTMQVGAVLEFDGATHDLVRLKQRAGSLVDGRGQPVNEALLTAALGGISRDAYRTMFSLDDQSLEAGGNAIIQSKGELGELLFSASTGLAGLSKSLLTAAEEAGALYKKRSSSTRMAELKRGLEALKSERNAIDTFAHAYAALTSAHAQAETSYATTMKELAERSSRLAGLNRILGALPLANELAGVTQKHAALGPLPRPPAEWFQRLPLLLRDETRLQALSESADRTIAALEQDIAEIEIDESILAVGAKIQGLDEARARHRTAEGDLPRRRIALAAQEAILSASLTALERAGEADPHGLLLPASLTGVLGDLIETRSGIDAELAGAERELKRSEDSQQRLSDEARLENAAAPAPSPALMARIERALAGLTGSDLAARLRVEQRARSLLQQDCERQRTLLAPWLGELGLEKADQGDAHARLLATPDADPRQIEIWRAEVLALDRRMSDHQAKARDLTTEQRQAEVKIAALDAGGPIGDDEAQALRKARDDAWQSHLAALDLDSARAFETRLGRDDALAAARLARARDLAELRQLTQSQTTTAAAIARQQELLEEARDEAAALAGKIAAALPAGTALADGASERLSAVERWSGYRSRALAAWERLQQAEATVAVLRSEVDTQATALAAALGQAGLTDLDALPAEDLLQHATTLLARCRDEATRQAAQAKALAAAERDIIERRRDRDAAKTAADSWFETWRKALSNTWFADKAGSMPAVREILKALAALPGVLREREQMVQRISTMERDQAQFQSEIAAILAELGEPPEPGDASAAADSLVDRHARAVRAQQSRAARQADLDREMSNRRALDEQSAVHAASKAELTEFFDTDTLAAVSHALDQVRERERLEARIGDLRQQISANLRVPRYEEAEQRLAETDTTDVETEAMQLTASIDDLTERSRQLFADASQARARLDAVGGDDAVARIEAEKRTIFLEIEDLAIRYLKLKTGGLAAERALHLYREKHRSSMMVRASEAFRLITGGAYAGLAARPDKDREILIGQMRDGGSKLAEQMSTGTQFQLYLALRLAGYEEYATVRPSVPFIADDIMESFDNPRSEEVFRLLGEMAHVGQVIYLTHHWHLCEIASKIVPGVTIHRLP